MSVILMFQFYVQGHSCFYAVFVLIFIEDQDYVAQFSIKFMRAVRKVRGQVPIFLKERVFQKC